METRTKNLVTLLVIVAVIAAGFYGYKFYIAEKPAPSQIVDKMGAPPAMNSGPAQTAPAANAGPTQAASAAKPGHAQAAPAATAGPAQAAPAAKPGPAQAVPAAKPGPAQAAPAAKPGSTQAVPAASIPAPGVPGKPAIAIKVMEKGKEIQYSSPEEFVAKTSLSPLEADEFSKKRLEQAKKRLEAARARKDKAAIAAADEDVKVSERLNSLVAVKVKESQGKKTYAYASLGKRDPFMNPLEVPKAYPPIPPNAKPVERVPIEQISLKAIIWNQKGYRAMVVTPDGRSYTVKSGERIGDKLGHITKITKNRIYVTEQIRDILGDVETKNTIMQLHHKEAE